MVDESPEGNTASLGSEGMNLGTMMITFVPLSFDLHHVTCYGFLHRDSTPSFSHCCHWHFLKLISVYNTKTDELKVKCHILWVVGTARQMGNAICVL